MPASSPRKARSGCGRAGSLTVTTGCSRRHRHRHDRRTEGQAVRGVHAGRCHHRSTLRRYRPWPCHHPQARAHDGWRRDRDERAGQRFGVHRALAGGLNAMHLPRRRFLHLAAGAAALPALSRIARAQAYPSRPVRIIVGFPAGGGVDILARLMGRWLSERLGQPFVIENQPGAGTNIATEAVVNASPDGYTLLFATAANALGPALYPNLKYDFIRDTAPVAGVAFVPIVMVVGPSSPLKTVADFVAYAKANPTQATIGTTFA